MSSSPLRVTFYCADQNPHRDRSLGITGYTQGLLAELQRSHEVALRAVVSKSSAAPPAGIPTSRIPFATDWTLGRLLSDHLHPLFRRTERADLWHYPKGFLPLIARVDAPAVATVHDTILQHYADHYPGTRSRADFGYWLHMSRRSIASADLILTVSDFSRGAILAFAERHKLACPPVHVTYQGTRFEHTAPDAENAKRDYVLHLASPLPHKKTRWLLETWEQLQRAGDELPELQLVGAIDTASAAVLARLAHAALRPAMNAEELARCMAQARALILPSEIEGFGLPAVEAYMLGTPVVFVAATAVAEIIGSGVPGFFEFDRESFHQALADVLAMDTAAIGERRQRLQEKYAWENCAAETLKAYRSAL